MAKKGPIGKVEAFYIDHHYQTTTPSDLALELDRTVRSIELYIKKNFTDKQKSVTSVKQNSDTLTAGDQFIRENGAVIMTENASTIADETRKYRKPTPRDNRITKIK